MKRNGGERGEERQRVWPKCEITVKGLVDRMSAGREDLIALLTKHGVHIPGKELDFGLKAVHTSSAPGHLLSRISTRLVFRGNAAICIPSAKTVTPPGTTSSGSPARKFQPLYLLTGKGSNLDGKKSKRQNCKGTV